MNENNATDHQRHRKIQDDVESVTEVSRLQVGHPRGDKHGGDSGSESGEVLRNIMKVGIEHCTAIETRAGDISAGKVGRGDLRGLD